MIVHSSTGLRWLYCLALAAAVYPFGVSGWVALTLGPPSMAGIPYVGPILLLLFGIWRIYSVATTRDLLDSYAVTGLVKALRVIGMLLMGLGIVGLMLQVTIRSFARSVVPHSSESGVEFYLMGLALALIGSAGTFGVVTFELSRLLGFERNRAGSPSCVVIDS